MAELFVYVALKNGTLGKPYVDRFRYVREGETVHLSQPIKAKWLCPKADYKPRAQNLPIMANMKVTVPMGGHNEKPKQAQIKDPLYERNMADIKKKESLEDASKMAAPPSPPAVPSGAAGGEVSETAPAGTGNAEVL